MKTLIVAWVVMLLAGASGCASTDSLINSGLWHYDAGLWYEASGRLQQGVPRLESSNPNDPRLPTALDALGTMAAADNRKDLALSFFRRALSAAERIKPGNETLLRNALVNEASFFIEEKRFAEAEPLLDRAKGISERNLSVRRMLYAIDLDNLGQAFAGQGYHDKADALSMKALAVVDSVPTAPDAALTRGIIYSNLGYSYSQQNKNVESEEAYKMAIKHLAEAAQGDSHEQWRVDANKKAYAELLRKLGRGEEAKGIDAH